MGKPSERQLERHIRQSAADSSHVAWTTHAQVRMRQRRINKAMALEVLRCGVISRPPESGIARDGLTCRMERFVIDVNGV